MQNPTPPSNSTNGRGGKGLASDCTPLLRTRHRMPNYLPESCGSRDPSRRTRSRVLSGWNAKGILETLGLIATSLPRVIGYGILRGHERHRQTDSSAGSFWATSACPPSGQYPVDLWHYRLLITNKNHIGRGLLLLHRAHPYGRGYGWN